MTAITGIGNLVVSGTFGSSEAFTSLYNWLTTSGSTVAGIQLIANNSGSRTTIGGGFGYWDKTTPVSNNCFAVFKFLSASIPYHMLLQVGTGSTAAAAFGQIPGNPGVLADGGVGMSANGGLGVQFAMNIDGSNPWNGDVAKVGADRKGTPVWTSGSSKLLVWPRANSVNGLYCTGSNFGIPNFTGSMQLCTTILGQRQVNGNSTTGSRLHAATDGDNIIFVRDAFDVLNTYSFIWFGPYDINSGSSLSQTKLTPSAAYCMLSQQTETSGLNPSVSVGIANVYGTVPGDTALEGGIAHPDPRFGVVGCSADTLGMWTSGTVHPNLLYPTPRYNELPISLFMNEKVSGTFSMGMLGQTSFMRLVNGFWNGDTNADKTRVVLGCTPTTVNASKFTMPWSPTAQPPLSGTVFGARTGTIW